MTTIFKARRLDESNHTHKLIFRLAQSCIVSILPDFVIMFVTRFLGAQNIWGSFLFFFLFLACHLIVAYNPLSLCIGISANKIVKTIISGKIFARLVFEELRTLENIFLFSWHCILFFLWSYLIGFYNFFV